MATNSSTIATTLSPTQNGSGVVSTSHAPTSTIMTTSIPANTTTLVIQNVTEIQPLIFLQTQAAQGIAGTFAFAAILMTCHQVRHLLPQYFQLDLIIIKQNCLDIFKVVWFKFSYMSYCILYFLYGIIGHR